MVVPLRQSGLETPCGRLSRIAAASRSATRGGHVHFHPDTEPDYCGSSNVRCLPAALGARMGERIRFLHMVSADGVSVGAHSLRVLCKRLAVDERCGLLYHRDFSGALPHRTFDGISPLEIVNEHAIAPCASDEVPALCQQLCSDCVVDS